MRARDGAICRAFGAIPPVYETPVKNMRAAQAAAVGLDQLAGDELKDCLKRVNNLLDAANAEQDRLNQLAKPADLAPPAPTDPAIISTQRLRHPTRRTPAAPGPGATMLRRLLAAWAKRRPWQTDAGLILLSNPVDVRFQSTRPPPKCDRRLARPARHQRHRCPPPPRPTRPLPVAGGERPRRAGVLRTTHSRRALY